MLRRIVAPAHLRYAGSVMASFSTTNVLRLEVDANERERELQLRQQVMQKYAGMQVPEMKGYTYGHFATSGINGAAANQAYRDVAGQGFARGFGFPGMPGSGNNGTGSGDASGGSVPPRPKVDWLMLLTGIALVYFSGRIMYNQATRGVDGIDLPLWTASIDRQALHLLFCVQFDREERERIKKDFQSVRQQYPLADFYEWLRSTRSEFGAGHRHQLGQALSTMVNALSGTDPTQLMELARTLQRSVDRRGGDPYTRLDDFMDKLTTMHSGIMPRSSWPGAAPPAQQPSFYPPSTQYRPMNGTQEMNVSEALNATDAGPHGSKPF